MFENVQQAFVTAAKAVFSNVKEVYQTGNGLRRLDFIVDGKEYSAIEQNKDKNSLPAEKAKEGHQVVQIVDMKAPQSSPSRMIGNVDLTENRFNAYNQSVKAVPIEEVQAALERVNNATTGPQLVVGNQPKPVASVPSQRSELENLLKTA